MTFRRTLQVVFAYNRAQGSLETYAKLTKSVKEQLEVIFAATILHWELDDYDPEAAYELDQLKDSSFDLTPDPADRLRIRIRKMRLSAKNSGRRLLVEVDDDDPHDDIHKAIEECINLEGVPLSEWHVTQVTFCFEFLPLGGRKPGRLSFTVSYPRSCGLRNARPEWVEVIQKYLKRWGIDLAAIVESSAVAVGT
jgi:septum formation topological specificity factor MinE